MGMSNPAQSALNDSLNWDFNFNELPDEDDPEVLTALVRTSYLRHLQRSLSKNYDHWVELNKENNDINYCVDDILKCANLLERKALRACMVTNFYQRAMVKTMKEIKQSTEEGSLFSPLIELLFDKNDQKTCEKEVQTNISLLTFKVSQDNVPQQPMAKEKTSPKAHYTIENSNLFIINPCNDLIAEKTQRKDELEDLFSILMSSPTYTEPSCGYKLHSPKKRKYMEEPPALEYETSFRSDSELCGKSIPLDHKNIKRERISEVKVCNENNFIGSLSGDIVTSPHVVQTIHDNIVKENNIQNVTHNIQTKSIIQKENTTDSTFLKNSSQSIAQPKHAQCSPSESYSQCIDQDSHATNFDLDDHMDGIVQDNLNECSSLLNNSPDNHTNKPGCTSSEDRGQKSNLDERLKTLAVLFGEETPKSEEESSKSNETTSSDVIQNDDETESISEDDMPFNFPVDWKIELAAHSCHLKRVLSRLSEEKLMWLAERYRVLFGSSGTYPFNTIISLNEEALCRKRNANIVVGQLTPYYIDGRIGSRIIFKSLARKITDAILSTSYIASHKEIGRVVNSCFEGGRQINSEKDVDSLPI